MREWVSGVVKNVTLEAIYKLIEERTQWIVENQEKDKQELLGYIQRLEEKQEKDKQEIFGVIHELRREFFGHVYRIEERQERFQEEVRAEFRHINQRFDTVVNMLLSLSLSKRKEE